ncbi:hypothetical protein QBC47DRAFT_109941 [Echria macrotheca]|uniref:Uncharacterized protein n=1 Tax=Echria macrotheca TaxID=438768 RepID=A0AAJ0FFX6_9PEZI|nr:hypothetical protein QBC47DRAFT_109941 [Echria macrotheca]
MDAETGVQGQREAREQTTGTHLCPDADVLYWLPVSQQLSASFERIGGNDVSHGYPHLGSSRDRLPGAGSVQRNCQEVLPATGSYSVGCVYPDLWRSVHSTIQGEARIATRQAARSLASSPANRSATPTCRLTSLREEVPSLRWASRHFTERRTGFGHEAPRRALSRSIQASLDQPQSSPPVSYSVPRRHSSQLARLARQAGQAGGNAIYA